MKKTIVIFSLLIALVAIPAQAQFKWGIKAGANFNKLSFDKKFVSTDNISDFSGGLLIEWTAPVLGLGFDAGLMYTRKGVKYNTSQEFAESFKAKDKRLNYLEIPVNLKYKLKIPAVEKIIIPLIYAGPSFNIQLDKLKGVVKNDQFDVAINLGVGLEFFRCLQVTAQYGWGLGNMVTVEKQVSTAEGVVDTFAKAKARTATVSVAYMF
jgi:hypothetical protein